MCLFKVHLIRFALVMMMMMLFGWDWIVMSCHRRCFFWFILLDICMLMCVCVLSNIKTIKMKPNMVTFILPQTRHNQSYLFTIFPDSNERKLLTFVKKNFFLSFSWQISSRLILRIFYSLTILFCIGDFFPASTLTSGTCETERERKKDFQPYQRWVVKKEEVSSTFIFVPSNVFFSHWKK